MRHAVAAWEALITSSDLRRHSRGLLCLAGAAAILLVVAGLRYTHYTWSSSAFMADTLMVLPAHTVVQNDHAASHLNWVEGVTVSPSDPVGLFCAVAEGWSADSAEARRRAVIDPRAFANVTRLRYSRYGRYWAAKAEPRGPFAVAPASRPSAPSHFKMLSEKSSCALSRQVAEIFLRSGTGGRVELRVDTASTGVALIAPREWTHAEDADSPYHLLAFYPTLWCLASLASMLTTEHQDVHVFPRTIKGNRWISEIIQGIGTWDPAKRSFRRIYVVPSAFEPASKFRNAKLIRSFVGEKQDSRMWEPWLFFRRTFAPDAFAMRLSRTIRTAALRGVRGESATPATSILILQRPPSHSARQLVGVQDGALSSILAAMCARAKLPALAVAVFDHITPVRTQAQSFARAKVAIAVHGLGLVNLLFMQPGSALIEVVLRYGWCCEIVEGVGGADRVQRGDLDPSSCRARGDCDAVDPRCSTKCIPYHKADYANMAQTFGIHYYPYDPVFVGPRVERNPIAVRWVMVDAPKFAEFTERVLFHRVSDTTFPAGAH